MRRRKIGTREALGEILAAIIATAFIMLMKSLFIAATGAANATGAQSSPQSADYPVPAAAPPSGRQQTESVHASL